MTNEKDKATTAQILRHYQIECGPMNAIQKDILESSIEKALATVRKEEREAALKDAAVIASDFQRLDQDTLWARYKTLTLETALLDAAENRKGEG